MLDALIILGYFAAVMLVAVRARLGRDVGTEEYFVSGRNLRWYSIAASTIATNLHAGHFLAVVGSAYAYGLAQANFELNAIFGLLMAAFVFVPLYLRARVLTITQFFEQKFGANVALAYSLLMMFLYGTLYLGFALFWGGYSLEILFGDGIERLVGGTPVTRISAIIVLLGAFSATYTYFGGLRAVVRTDLIQFVLLIGGGLTVTVLALRELGGPAQLYGQTGDLMHLHLPNSHPKLPWLGIVTMNLLNLQYWGCNQIILQRSLAARSLRDAQIGLLTGGFVKFVTAGMLVLPGIALVGILGDERRLADPDQAYLKIVDLLLAPGVRGLVLCGLFASLMSSVDSIFNSISTLWSIDVYRKRLAPTASEAEVVTAGRRAILATMCIGILCGFAVVYVKFADPSFPLDPFYKQTGYYIKNGFVILIAAAVFLVNPPRRLVLGALVFMVPFTIVMNRIFAEVPYLILTGIIIVAGLLLVAVPTIARNGWRLPPGERLIRVSDRGAGALGVVLALGLVLAHIVFH
jgi:SSS family solute:Na+ symporter